MKIIENESVIFCDIDDTLTMWQDTDDAVWVRCPHYGEKYKLAVNRGNLKILKDRKARGSFIVVWSAGGYAWANAVVQALGIEKYVDQIMSKPIGYIDDRPAEKILGEHIYIPHNSGYGKRSYG
jgi:phosphoserine phosphatase